MTNKAKFGLGLVALHQLDIVWDVEPGKCKVIDWSNGHPDVISSAKVEHTLTRHSDALEKALEGIMDSHLGKGIKVSEDKPLEA